MFFKNILAIHRKQKLILSCLLCANIIMIVLIFLNNSVEKAITELSTSAIVFGLFTFLYVIYVKNRYRKSGDYETHMRYVLSQFSLMIRNNDQRIHNLIPYLPKTSDPFTIKIDVDDSGLYITDYLDNTYEITISEEFLNYFSDDELCALLSHEVGHLVYKDGYKHLCITILGIGLFSLTSGLLCIFSVVITYLVIKYTQRLAEYTADEFAAKHDGTENIIHALDKLRKMPGKGIQESERAYAHNLLYRMLSTHPSFDNRIANLKKKNI